jgi:hypothetical protein
MFLQFSQTVYGRLCDVCLLAREYETIPLVKKILKLLVSLAYLEPAMVVRGFQVSVLTIISVKLLILIHIFFLSKLVQNYLASQRDLVSERIHQQLNLLLVYYQTTWIDLYGPELFCIGGNEITTNNNLETTNRALNAKFGSNPGLIPWIGTPFYILLYIFKLRL